MRSESSKAEVPFTHKQKVRDFKGWQATLFQWVAYSWIVFGFSCCLQNKYLPVFFLTLKEVASSHLCLLALFPQIKLYQSIAGNQRGQVMGKEWKDKKLWKSWSMIWKIKLQVCSHFARQICSLYMPQAMSLGQSLLPCLHCCLSHRRWLFFDSPMSAYQILKY